MKFIRTFRDMRQHAVPVLQLDREHRVGERLDDRAFLDRISFRHGRCWVPFSRECRPGRADTRTRSVSEIGYAASSRRSPVT